jgi:hypothetical protein
MSPKQEFELALAPFVEAAVKHFNEHDDQPFLNDDDEPDSWNTRTCWYTTCIGVQPDALIKLYLLDLSREDSRYFEDDYIAQGLKEFRAELFKVGVLGLIAQDNAKFSAALAEVLEEQLSEGVPIELLLKIDPTITQRDEIRDDLLDAFEQANPYIF